MVLESLFTLTIDDISLESRNHYNVFQTKPKRTLEKLQLLATA